MARDGGFGVREAIENSRAAMSALASALQPALQGEADQVEPAEAAAQCIGLLMADCATRVATDAVTALAPAGTGRQVPSESRLDAQYHCIAASGAAPLLASRRKR